MPETLSNKYLQDMEKQEFIQKYNDVKESVIKAMDEALKRACKNG